MTESLDKLKSELLARLVRGELTTPQYQELLAEIERHQVAKASGYGLPNDASADPLSRADAPTSFRPELLAQPSFEGQHSDPGAATRYRPLNAPELRVGLKVSKFELREFLGQGGMGQVWKAWDPSRQGFVVLKFLPPELLKNAEEATRFRETYRRVWQLDHPHICRLFDLGEDAHFGEFQVMQFIPGEPLHQWKRRHVDAHGRLTLELVLRVLRPLAEALDYAHSQGIIHRDVKPANILVNETPWEVHIIDFGLAAQIQSAMSKSTKRVSMESSGTEAYMAPEQWLGKFQDHQTDQYSLGVVAYELLAGHLPFQGASPQTLGFAVCQSPVSWIPELPDVVNSALLRVLAKSRQDRFDSCLTWIGQLDGSMPCGAAIPKNGTNTVSDQSRSPSVPDRLEIPPDEWDAKKPSGIFGHLWKGLTGD